MDAHFPLISVHNLLSRTRLIYESIVKFLFFRLYSTSPLPQKGDFADVPSSLCSILSQSSHPPSTPSPRCLCSDQLTHLLYISSNSAKTASSLSRKPFKLVNSMSTRSPLYPAYLPNPNRQAYNGRSASDTHGLTFISLPRMYRKSSSLDV